MGIFDNARKNFDINLSLGDFRNEDDFFDVTLAADSSNGSIEAIRAHKLILSACSPVLRSLLREQSRLNASSQMMPVMLYLRGISTRGLKHVLDFVYRGSISLPQEELNDFLAVGESLQIPMLERPKMIPTKRKSVPNTKKKRKRARVVLPSVLPKNDKVQHNGPESAISNVPENILSGIEINIKSDPGTEDMYERDTDQGPGEDLCKEEVDLDEYQEGNIAEEPIASASEGNLTGLHPPSVDDLMQSKVKACDGRFVCMICGKSNGRSDSMRRHMRDLHLSTDEDYHCPPCNKYFKNRQSIYSHIRSNHKDWKGIDYEYFRVNSLPRPMPL